MLFLLPILIIIAIIVAIDQLYFNDPVPKDTTPKKELHQNVGDRNSTQKYLDRYIKK